MLVRTVTLTMICSTWISMLTLTADPAVQTAPGQPRGGQVAQNAHWMTNDQILANCIAIANQTEVTVAKIAEEKAHNNDVKDFAKMMLEDHSSFLQKLQRYAPEATREGYLRDHNESAAGRSSAQNPVQTAGGQVPQGTAQIQQTAGQQPGGPESAQPINFIQLHREVAEECVHSAKKMMSKKNGAEFDECYVGFQIAAHAEMKDKLIVFKRHASADLGQIIEDGIVTTDKHLKKAEQLMKQLADAGKSAGTKSENK